MKYKLRKDLKIDFHGRTLYRIQRIDTKEIGGYVEREENLYQEGNAWIFENAKVYGNALIYGDALVFGDSEVCGNAKVYGNAKVCGNALIYGCASIFGNALIYGDATVSESAWIFENAKVCGNSKIRGTVKIYGNSQIKSANDLIHIEMEPYCVTITPQNIVIGCKLKSRFGEDGKWINDISATPDVRDKYLPLLNNLKKLVKRKKAK